MRTALTYDVRGAAERYHDANIRLADARIDLVGAIREAHREGVPQTRLAKEAGVDRLTIRKWLGYA